MIERLTKDASERIEKTHKMHEDLNNEVSNMYPFKPQLSTFSGNSMMNKTMFKDDGKDFFERQQEFLHRQHEKREKYRNEEGKEFSFKPQINSTSGIIIEADPSRANETAEERYNRLYHKDVQKAEETRYQIEQELYGHYNYQPQINPLSRLMAADRPAAHMLDSTQNKSTLAHMIHQELDEKKRKEYTFKPKINNNYPEVKSAYANKEELKAKLEEKARERRLKGDQERKVREYQELKDCTFKPAIKELPRSHQEVVVVRGLARHMELQEMKIKKTQDQLEREAKVFGLGHKFAPDLERTHLTHIPDIMDWNGEP